MAIKNYKPEKIYYTIREVSEMLSVPNSTLRVWEKNFDELKPRRTNTGNRLYTKDDINMIAKIRDLLKEQGMTINGAKQRLKNNPEQVDRSFDVITSLKSIRDELQDIIDQL